MSVLRGGLGEDLKPPVETRLRKKCGRGPRSQVVEETDLRKVGPL